MAGKGDRAILDPQARRMYTDGQSIPAIAAALGVSATSLYKWKAESLTPGDELDGWDKARHQKRGNIQRLRDLFEEQLEFMEDLLPVNRTAPMMDTLSKLGALLERWDKMEKAHRVADDVVREVKRAGLSDEAADSIRHKILGVGQ
jgi:transposase